MNNKTTRNLFLVFMVILVICGIAAVKLTNNDEVYQSNWDTINVRPIPIWYDQAKFGMGVYSVPAFANKSEPSAEWYWDTWKHDTDGGWTAEYHNRSFGADFTYQDFASMFTAHLFDANKWANLIEKSGAKYVVLTSKHHEGFPLWPSKQAPNWNSVDVGPKRDIVGELSTAIKNKGINMGLYYSLFEWFNPLYLEDKSTGKPPKTENYVDDIMIPQMKDIVNKYEPSIVWTDGEWEEDSDYWKSTEFLTWLFASKVGDKVVVNDRWGKDCRGKNGGFYTGGDRMNPGHLMPHKFENCATISTSWGYNQNEDADTYQSVEKLITTLVETVSCGGNLLLNIGPTKEGVIVVAQQQSLLGIGEWLSINGEGIYSSVPWRVQNDSTSLWYTYNSDSQTLYAFMTGNWPTTNQIQLISPITNSKTAVQLLGYDGPSLSFNPLDNGGLNIKLPLLTPGKYPPHNVYTLKITNVK
ncbi:alpha-fucosidase [Heterostelium album PN500]|uniref:alpha-L-fucosidase n=1 Tax=Heterostelium pallidum (strain ATCC 26659 / Pp 5 / PN500) TaxID=670386 RepID=D3AWU7_HETP5|nr:alpha-fucosidase [Heterostelium album PN500]EFA86770.1 alpha-fucosidase [Heterostelium album PN500]|eukprot:XP_020438874.1 alpha-fucosidase [Heterostelium album PN500]